MALFKSDIEKKIEKEYVPMLAEILGTKEAIKLIEGIIASNEAGMKKQGYDKIPENYGDIFLHEYNQNEKIKKSIDEMKVDGVTDDDIRWYWNMNYQERLLNSITYDLNYYITLLQQLKKTQNRDEAKKNLRKIFAVFGSYDDAGNYIGDSQPLPLELKKRVDNYMIKRMKDSPKEFKEELEKIDNLNAFIRKEIRNGNL